MDLEPNSRINPCGYAGLPRVDVRVLGVHARRDVVADRLTSELERLLRPR